MKTGVKITLGIFLFFIVVGVFSALIGDNNPTGETISNKQINSNSEPLTILSHNLDYTDYGGLMITGVAKNTGNKKLNYAQVDVKFYDAENNVLGNSFDNINNLGAGETWKFKVVYLGTDDYNVDSYNISVGATW